VRRSWREGFLVGAWVSVSVESAGGFCPEGRSLRP
jgi:hypothetical protein